jgi:DNA-binding response OmpR family regulator
MALKQNTALIACCHRRRKELYAQSALREGWDVHTVSRGIDALDLLHKRRYDLVVIDESIEDRSPLEFSLSVADIASNKPAIIVAANHFTPVKALRDKCRVIDAASTDELPGKLSNLLGRVAISQV